MKIAVLAAPAKVNLSLFLGPVRADGRHELVTLFQTVSLADSLAVSDSPSGRDEVVCDDVEGPNLVSDALAGLRAAGWAAPPVRVQIVKRIPVAAGMGGGSADAAALLRYAPTLAAVPDEAVAQLAAQLGADVPSRLLAGAVLGTGAGEVVVSPVSALAEHAVLVLPQDFGLSTADVYREADRLGLPRSAAELDRLRAELDGWLAEPSQPPPESLIANDLQAAAVSLRPEIEADLEVLREVGAHQSLVCGSGPTVIGVFWGPTAVVHARAAAQGLRARYPRLRAVQPV
ncbi:MAG: 4-(cytidine 5'-diphospho)-2-C-methyl-D-erythritol kinase [Solirubrobacteraceae bacterium]